MSFLKISRCTNLTASRVLDLTELIQRALENDKQSRDQGIGPGSAEKSSYDKVNVLTKVKFLPTFTNQCSICHFWK